MAHIHSFETFGTVDGPGIRFVVFMQGCHLRCKYCHNRDTWDINAGEVISIKELVNKIEKYITYFKASKGGVTVSGGEPLLQVEFLITLFKELKKLEIHTAIDTSGMVDITDKVKELISLTDLFLLDIKHINSEKCKELVGFSNEKEIEFARYLNSINKPMWIRQVLIPGLTNQKEDLLKLKEFIKSLSNVEKVEILKYHDMGKFKWEQMGYKYELENIPNATDEDVKKAKEILEI
ncbi:MAG: pyruvate formate lyase-activating protein [Clostridia bacterium]|nr:pyruvate formate lyase-activating protein [Clostridia bacterium]